MGWTFTMDKDKAGMVEELLAGARRPGNHLVAHRVIGNTLWTVEDLEQSEGRRLKVIGCYRLAKEKGYGWGYKAMDEGMGPCYYDVPLKFLELQPNPLNRYSEEWRAKVVAYHASKTAQRELARNIVAGCRITLKPEYGKGMTLEVISVEGKKIRARANGLTYRVAPRMVASIEYQLTSIPSA